MNELRRCDETGSDTDRHRRFIAARVCGRTISSLGGTRFRKREIMTADEVLHHRSQAYRIVYACERLARERIGRYAEVGGILLGSYRIAVSSCEGGGSDFVMARSWKRVARKIRACLDLHLQDENDLPGPGRWPELAEVIHSAKIVDLSAQMAQGQEEEDEEYGPETILADLREEAIQVEQDASSCRITGIRLLKLTEDEQRLLTKAGWSGWYVPLHSAGKSCCLKCALAQHGYIIYATRYMIRFADNEIDSLPETRRLCVYYRECSRIERVDFTPAIIEQTIRGRLFVAEGGQAYYLGNQEPIYQERLISKGVTPDEDNPFDFDRREGEKWVWGPSRPRS